MNKILELLNVEKINGGVGKYKCYRFAISDNGCFGIFQDTNKENPYASESCFLFIYINSTKKLHIFKIMSGSPTEKYNQKEFEILIELVGAIEQNV